MPKPAPKGRKQVRRPPRPLADRLVIRQFLDDCRAYPVNGLESLALFDADMSVEQIQANRHYFKTVLRVLDWMLSLVPLPREGKDDGISARKPPKKSR